MSIQEQKITEAAIAANGVQSRPDKLTGTAAQNKKVFDALVTAVVREKFNALLDELTGTAAAAQLGITTIPGFSAGDIQTALEQIVQAMQDVTQGSVTDGSITLAKLAAEVTAVALGGAAATALPQLTAVIGLVFLAEGAGLIAIGEHLSALGTFDQTHYRKPPYRALDLHNTYHTHFCAARQLHFEEIHPFFTTLRAGTCFSRPRFL